MGTWKLGRREIDLERREVRCEGVSVPLSANEVGLLSVLLSRAGQVVDRDVLLTEGLGYRTSLNTRAIDQAVWRLRKKIEDEPNRPVYLRSEPGSGYRFVLNPDRAQPLVGRAAEREALSRWLSQGESEIWVVGAPGVGRSALVGSLGPTSGANLRVETTMPDDPSIRALRLAPLPEDDARVLLIDRVLALRGTTSLAQGEADALAALLSASGGFPSVLLALADEALLCSLTALAKRHVPPPQPLVAFVCGLSAEDLAVASALASIPDPVEASEASEMFGAQKVLSAWRSCAIEARDERGERWFFVSPPVGRALESAQIAPSPSEMAKVVRVLQETFRQHADRVLRDGSSASRAALDRRQPTLFWLFSRTRDPDLLFALLFTRRAAPLPPLPEPGDDIDARVARDLIVASQHERSDPARRTAILEAMQRLSPSPRVERLMVQQWARVLFYNHAPTEQLSAAVRRLQRVTERLDTPYERAIFLVIRSMLEHRKGNSDLANEDLIAALRLLEQTGAAEQTVVIRTNLAAQALSDGRCAEGIAWIELALAQDAGSAAAESNRRLLLAGLLCSMDRIDEAEQQVELAEILGTHPVHVAIERAWCDLFRGDPARAEVRMRTVLGSPIEPEGHIEVMLAWTRLLQGDPEEAMLWLSKLARPWSGDPWGLRLTEIVLHAASGRADVSERLLHAAPEQTPRWWPRAAQVGAAWIAHARGESTDHSTLKEAIARDPNRCRPVTAACTALSARSR